jgi:TonB family protein
VAISVEGDRLVLSIDRAVIARAAKLDVATGYMAFELHRGLGAEIRNIRLVQVPWAGASLVEWTGARANADPGLVLPALLKDVKPFYPREPFDKKLGGAVLLEGVVEADGSVGDLRVERSLHVDLDESAMAHLRQWRFKPAMKDGAAVACLVKFEIQFRLF